jgi:hypothetical protein
MPAHINAAINPTDLIGCWSMSKAYLANSKTGVTRMSMREIKTEKKNTQIHNVGTKLA